MDILSIVCLVIFILLLIGFIYYINFYNQNLATVLDSSYFNKNFPVKDTLIHLNSSGQYLTELVKKIYMLYPETSFISLTDLYLKKTIELDSYFSKKKAFITKGLIKDDNGLLQKFSECKHKDNYSAVSFKSALPIESENYYLTDDRSVAYIRKFKKIKDGKEFYYIQIKIDKTDDVFEKDNYQLLANMLQFIKDTFTDSPYIIVGNFGVHNHESIFKPLFDEKNYFIVPLYKTVTNIDQKLTSFDGLVVSKALYDRIEYRVDFFPGNNNPNFILIADLYDKGPKFLNDITDKSFKNYIESVVKENKLTNYMNTQNVSSLSIKPDKSKIVKTDLIEEINKSSDSTNYIIESIGKYIEKYST